MNEKAPICQKYCLKSGFMHDSLFEVSKLHTTCTLVYSLKWLVWVKEVKGKHSMAISVILGESRVLLQLVRTKVSFIFF